MDNEELSERRAKEEAEVSSHNCKGDDPPKVLGRIAAHQAELVHGRIRGNEDVRETDRSVSLGHLPA